MPGIVDNPPASAGAGAVFVLPTSLGQERFWGLDRLNPGNPTWNVPVRFRLQGTLNTAFVERAFNQIVSRHETLRTTFALVDGQLSQLVGSCLNIEVPITDLRHVPKPERDAEVDRLSLKEARWRFDLTTGPLFRVSLFRVEDNEHVLLVTPHHSIIDYWSIGLISNELGALYDAHSRGVDPVLPALPIQYGDFAVWQRQQAEETVVQNELTYWKERLKDLPLLDFPTDRPRAAFPTYDATITSVLLPVPLTDAMREIANRNGATFFNTMLAALSIVLRQYTGQIDFGVATQVAGRNSVELESLIGYFINTVVLRMDLAGDPTFPQLLGRVQEVGLQSIANQNVRFEQLLKALRPKDYPSHHTLFRVNFICQRDPVKPLEFSGIKLTVIPSKSQGALYDLNVFLVLRNEGWRLACEYNTDLFEAATITRLLGDYRTLLEQIVRNPDRQISEFPRSEDTPVGEQRMKVAGLSASSSKENTSAKAAAPRSLGSAAAVELASSAAEPAFAIIPLEESETKPYVLPTSVAQRRFWTLEEFAPGNPALHMRACVRLTGRLPRATLEKSFQLLVDRHETLRTTFEKADGELIQVIAPSRTVSVRMTSLEEVAEADRDARLWELIRAEASAPFDLAEGPLMRARLFCLQPQEHVLIITTHHILVDGWSQGVIQRDLWTIYDSLCQNREVSLPPLAIQYGDFAHWQREWLASDAAATELDFWTKQLASPLPVLNFPTDWTPRNRPAFHGAMETLLLPEDLIQSLKRLSQSQDVSMFMLMLTGWVGHLRCYADQEDIVISSPVANRKPDTEALVGPFAGPVTLRLNLSGNPTSREVLERVRDVTVEALSHTDLPFEVLLEKLDVRSVQGRNPLSQCYFFYQTAFLQPRELHDLTVIPLPDFSLGTHFELQLGLLERREGVRAQLEYNPDLFAPATIRRTLEDYQKVLEAMLKDPEIRMAQLPVSKKMKSVPIQLAMSSRPEVARPQDDTEKLLRKIWEDLLGVRPVGLKQNYFELGGNSILAVRLFAQIEKVFRVKLPLSTLFEAQTVEEFACVIRNAGSAGWSPLVTIQPNGSRPPFFCVHGGGGNVLIYRDLSRHLGPDQPFYGLQSQGLDGERPYLTRIEDMAALYTREIRRAQPGGPYYLGGYCLGGTIALEIAQQLLAQGEEVALLALFDTMNWSRIPVDTFGSKARHQAERVKFHTQNFLLLNFRDKVKFFREKMKVLRNRAQIWRGILLSRLSNSQRASKTESRVLARIWKTNDRACVAYIAKPYPGMITDFRPLRQYSKYLAPGSDWSGLAREGVEAVTLPVYPAGMLLEPFVTHLAAALKASIGKAIQRAKKPQVQIEGEMKRWD
jgi:non-ribosomal peptide synthetase component F/thioesterase domain-containing protein